MSWFPSFLKVKPAELAPQPGATPRTRRPRQQLAAAGTSTSTSTSISSIVNSPVSVIHRLADEPEDELQLELASEGETAAGIHRAPPAGAAPVPNIVATVNHGVVEFRVSNMAAAVSYETLQGACAAQLPHVVLERTTKWLQYTFDLWSRGDSCLYVIPIASMNAEPAVEQPVIKPRRRGSDLASHHPRG